MAQPPAAQDGKSITTDNPEIREPVPAKKRDPVSFSVYAIPIAVIWAQLKPAKSESSISSESETQGQSLLIIQRSENQFQLRSVILSRSRFTQCALIAASAQIQHYHKNQSTLTRWDRLPGARARDSTLGLTHSPAS
ncbi:hypothetical protein J6590_015213 [Homalodisca vitripennis]|nr:hypothetical protein J6590_015213 [Homalodisca vitripennis]